MKMAIFIDATFSSIYRHLINHNDRKWTAVNGPIPPWAIHSKETKLGEHQSANNTSFEWRVAGVPMVVPGCMLAGSVLPNILMKWGKGNFKV